MKLSSLILTSASLLTFTGCMTKDKGAGTDTAQSQLDQQDSVEAESNMMMESTDGADMAAAVAITADVAAGRIAANIMARWTPSSCATVTQTGANLVVMLNDCTGSRRHLVHVTGELDIAVAVDATSGAIDVHATSDSLMVNGADLVVDADAVYTRTGDDRKIVVHTTGSGTGPRGNDIEHQGDYTATWNPVSMCGSIAGHWQTDFTGATATAERSNDVNVSRCATGCPTGTITHHYLRGASLTITFDGTATAAWTTSLGGSGTVALQCQ